MQWIFNKYIHKQYMYIARKVGVKYLCGRGIDFALFYDFDFEIVPTVWYFLFVILLVWALEAGRNVRLWLAFLSSFAASTNKVYNCGKCTYIACKLQCGLSKRKFNLDKKWQEHWTFLEFSLGPRSNSVLCFSTENTGYQETLYMYV